jgi:hypothetical protein
VVDDVLEELQVGRHAADAELAQRAVHALDGLVGVWRPGRDLDQQRVVVRRDHRAAVGRAAVEPDAEAGRAAVGGDAAVVGREAVLRVLGGDAALQRVAVERMCPARHGRSGVAASPMRAPSVMRICALTMSMPVTSSVTVCSTWMRGLTSMK